MTSVFVCRRCLVSKCASNLINNGCVQGHVARAASITASVRSRASLHVHSLLLSLTTVQVWITHVSKTNPTYLNGTPLVHMKPVCLRHRDTFIIAGRMFRIDYGTYLSVLCCIVACLLRHASLHAQNSLHARAVCRPPSLAAPASRDLAPLQVSFTHTHTSLPVHMATMYTAALTCSGVISFTPCSA